MAELINKEAVIDIITERCLDCNAVDCSKCKVAAMQMKIESLDMVEVIHGVWEKDGTRCECSNCSAFANLGQARVWKHCPMCGATMNEKE